MELSLSPSRTLHIKLKKSLFIYYPELALTDPDVTQSSAIIFPGPIAKPPEGPKLLIDGAGEFEVDDLSVRGVNLGADAEATSYQLANDAAAVILLPPSPLKAYTDSILEAIGVGQVVVAVVPVGDFSAADAAKTVRLFDPQVVIPLSAKSTNPNLDKFLAELGASEPKTEPVFKTKDLALLGEVLQVVVLEG